MGHSVFLDGFRPQFPEYISARVPREQLKKTNSQYLTPMNVNEAVALLKADHGGNLSNFHKALDLFSLDVLFAALWTLRFNAHDLSGKLDCLLFTALSSS